MIKATSTSTEGRPSWPAHATHTHGTDIYMSLTGTHMQDAWLSTPQLISYNLFMLVVHQWPNL